jgi:hypothetical protein
MSARISCSLSPTELKLYARAAKILTTGKPEEAIMVLQGAHNAHPNDVDILTALIAFNRAMGNHQASRSYDKKAAEDFPLNINARSSLGGLSI